MRVLVCGGRDFCDVPWLWAELDWLDKQMRISAIIDGAQRADNKDGHDVGADHWAFQWALARNRASYRYPADWKGYGRSAGPKRNRRMGEESQANLVVPFPRASGEYGDGTRGMVQIARGLGIKVHFPRVIAERAA